MTLPKSPPRRPDSDSRPEQRRGRNPGAPFHRAWALGALPDAAEVDRALAGLQQRSRAAVSGESESCRLLLALQRIDLTTLSGDDNPQRVQALCGRARDPLPPRLLEALGATHGATATAAVCVYHHFLDDAREALEGSGVRVAVVSAGFPAGLSPLRQRIDEVAASASAGADEIDVVINRANVLDGRWGALYEEVRAFRDAAGDARVKVILATGDLGTLTNIAAASRIAMLAGADFIKTSTGKEAANATLPAGLVMLRAIAEYRALTGHEVGFKPAGGIRTAEDAVVWLQLVEETLGPEWLSVDRFRIGASGLLTAIVERLEGLVAGAASGVRAAPSSDY